MITAMMRRFENNPLPATVHDSGSGLNNLQHENLISQNQNLLITLVLFHIPQPMSALDHMKILQYKEVSVGIDKETKERIEELENHLK